ncbi:SUZ domain-containing protein 1-like isoform X2 [Arapaima gigas]
MRMSRPALCSSDGGGYGPPARWEAVLLRAADYRASPAEEEREPGLGVCLAVRDMGDEELSESREEAAESEDMERHLEEKLKVTPKQKVSSGGPGQLPLKTAAVVIQNESVPATAQPQIRILKRPSSNGSLGSPPGAARPVPQIKSLAQREAEYAEARRRILGSASPDKSPQDRPATESKPVRVSSQQPSVDSRTNSHSLRQTTGPEGTQGLRHRK